MHVRVIAIVRTRLLEKVTDANVKKVMRETRTIRMVAKVGN